MPVRGFKRQVITLNFLTVKECAALKGCSERYIKRLALNNSLEHQESVNANGKKKYLIPLSALDPPLQRKWYKLNGLTPPAALADAAIRSATAKVLRPLDFYSVEQREKLDAWIKLLEDWQSFRKSFTGSKGEADEAFIHERRLDVSVATLHRKLAAYRGEDWDSLIDKRGQANKGKSDFSSEIRDLFEYFYLDKTAINIKKCLEAAKGFLKRKKVLIC